MKMLSAAIIGSTVVLGACAPEPVTRVETSVSVASVPSGALGAATGLPADAVVAASRTGNQYTVFYRGDAVTADQVAAAPAIICANTASQVFSAEAVDTSGPQFGGGVQRMTVTCS